jgi:hypothetical protein
MVCETSREGRMLLVDSDPVGRVKLTIFLIGSNKSSTIQSTSRPCFTIASAVLGCNAGSTNKPISGPALVSLEAVLVDPLFFAVGSSQNVLRTPFPLAVTPPWRDLSQWPFPEATRRSAVD